MITDETATALRAAAAEIRAVARGVHALTQQERMTKAERAKIGTIFSQLRHAANGADYLAGGS